MGRIFVLLLYGWLAMVYFTAACKPLDPNRTNSPGKIISPTGQSEDATPQVQETVDPPAEPPADPPPAPPSIDDLISSSPNQEFVFTELSPNQISMAITLRDFSDKHPDFENGSATGHITGLVKPTLTPQRKPILSEGHQKGHAHIDSQQSFDQWFANDKAANEMLNTNLKLTLVPDSSNVYEYEDSNFFPLNDKLLKNEGRENNYHFTLETHSYFTYSGGEVFEFFGDDDVWVYINDKLVVDLGGVHGQVLGNVNLDDLGLEKGKKYPFDMFFAERQTTQSHFKIQTSIEIESNQFNYQIELKENAGSNISFVVKEPAGASVDGGGLVSYDIAKSHVGTTINFVIEITIDQKKYDYAFQVKVVN